MSGPKPGAGVTVRSTRWTRAGGREPDRRLGRADRGAVGCNRQQPAAFTLRVPAGMNVPLSVAARRELNVAVERMRNAGLGVVGARLRPYDRHLAVCELYGPREYDRISMSTLESSRSRG